MDVVLLVGGEVIVDDQRDLLNVDTTGEQVRCNENTRRTRTELLHDKITLSLVHITVHSGDGKVTGSELVSEPVDLSAGVAEDDSLSDGDGLVEIREGIELPVLLFNSNVELLDTFEGQFSLLDQNTDRVAHELGRNLQDVLRHGGREKDDLGGLGKKLEDIINLLGETTLEVVSLSSKYGTTALETYRKHFISLIENEDLDSVGLQGTPLDHVVDTAGSTDNDMNTIAENLHVLTEGSTTNAGMALDLQEIANGDNDLHNLLSQLTGRGEDQGLALVDVEVDLLEYGDGEGRSLTSAGLGLCNNVAVLDDGNDSTLLDSRGALETISVDTSQELRLEIHGIKVVDRLIVVGVNLLPLNILQSFISHVGWLLSVELELEVWRYKYRDAVVVQINSCLFSG